jgi:hypothetical protein
MQNRNHAHREGVARRDLAGMDQSDPACAVVGPKGFRNTFYEFDLRPGGVWRFTMQAPNGNEFLMRPEHAVGMFRLLPHALLALLPGTDHMALMRRSAWLVPMISDFLNAAMPKSSNGWVSAV